MEWVTTTTILDGLRDFSNETAWGRLAARFRGPVVRFARQMGLRADLAEDVAQETLLAFAQAYRRGAYVREQGRLSRWMFGIAFRQALAARRAAARQEVGADPAPLAAIEETAASQTWDREWEQALLEQCLQQARSEFELPTWRAFEATVRDGVPVDEAAAQLGVTLKSVYNARHRVLKRIRELRDELEGVD